MVADRKKADRLSRHRPGFTLVELLTVIGIIALLISILLPSLSRARMQAKKVKTAGTLSAIEKGLEMFRNDFDQYPDSSLRPDPVLNLPAPGGGTLTDGELLSGAHWLARALVGPDFRGVDADGKVLRDGSSYTIPYKDPNPVEQVVNLDRKGVYLESDKLARDTDSSRFRQSGSPATGRPVVFDEFDGPILYYRASPRAQEWVHPCGPAMYCQLDNSAITGSNATDPITVGWDFAGVRSSEDSLPVHPMGQMGNYMAVNPEDVHQPPEGIKGKTFADCLHNHSAGEAGGVLRPHNAERFILISPSDDGLYGTDDDVSNFKSAL